MAYYLRAFCTSDATPPLDEILEWARAERGVTLAAEANAGGVTLDSRDWRHAAISYAEGKLPLLVEIDAVANQDDAGSEEIEEFLNLVENAASPSKNVVIEHLRRTKMIVALALPTPDVDEAGYEAAAAFLDYFVAHSGGLVQADGEGFYDGNVLLLELE